MNKKGNRNNAISRLRTAVNSTPTRSRPRSIPRTERNPLYPCRVVTFGTHTAKPLRETRVKLRKLFLRNKSQQGVFLLQKKRYINITKSCKSELMILNLICIKLKSNRWWWPDFFSQSSLRRSADSSETDGLLPSHFFSAYRISPLLILSQNF